MKPMPLEGLSLHEIHKSFSPLISPHASYLLVERKQSVRKRQEIWYNQTIDAKCCGTN